MNTRGSDQNPIEVDDAEFASSWIINKDNVALFANPPSVEDDSDLRKAQVDSLHKLELGEGKSLVTLTNGKESKLLGVIGQPLTAGQKVLARAVPGDDAILQVAVYKNNQPANPDMPEDGYGVSIQHLGYVRKEHLDIDPDYKEKFSSPVLNRSRSIFPNINLVDDVNQSIFGDCFLLASINGLLARQDGADYIKSIMRQEGSHTIVRLYDPNSNEFVHYKIKNSIHQINGKKTVRHKAPWIHILEKAYTYHAMRKNAAGSSDNREIVPGYASFRDIFGGGHPAVAMLVLTGKPAEEIRLPESTSIPWNADVFMYCMSLYNKLQLPDELTGEYSVVTPEYMDKVLNELFDAKTLSADEIKYLKNDIFDDLNAPSPESAKHAQIKKFKQFLVTLIGQNEDKQAVLTPWLKQYISAYLDFKRAPVFPVAAMLGDLHLMLDMGQAFKEQVLEKGTFQEFFDEFQSSEIKQNINVERSWEKLNSFITLPPKAEAKFSKIFEVERNLTGTANESNGVAGTGRYSEAALKLYDNLKLNLEQGKSLVASTPGYAKPAPVGLFGNHAYTIIGVDNELHNGREILYVKMRNPWGHSGRKYQWANNGPEEKLVPHATKQDPNDNGEFEVELSDFMLYFYRYTVSQKPDIAQQQVASPAAPEPTRLVLQSKLETSSLLRGVKYAASYLAGALLGAALGVIIGIVLAPFTSGLSLFIFPAVGLIAGGILLGRAFAKTIDGPLATNTNKASTVASSQSSSAKSLRFFGKRKNHTMINGSPEISSSDSDNEKNNSKDKDKGELYKKNLSLARTEYIETVSSVRFKM